MDIVNVVKSKEPLVEAAVNLRPALPAALALNVNVTLLPALQ